MNFKVIAARKGIWSGSNTRMQKWSIIRKKISELKKGP